MGSSRTYTRPCIFDEDPEKTKPISQWNSISTLTSLAVRRSLQRRLAKPLAAEMNAPCNIQSGAIKSRLPAEGLNASSRPGP